MLAVVVLLVSIAQIAQADCGAVAVDDRGERFQLGKLAIGSPGQMVLAGGVTLADCEGAAGSGCHGEDESYGIGRDGLRYYLRAGRLFRISLDDISRYHAPLIGGIYAGEGVGDVRVKINRLATPFPSWSYISFHDGNGPIFSTDLCWQGVGNDRWGIALFHDMNGRLMRIEEAADLSSVSRVGEECLGKVVDDVDDRGSLGEILFGAPVTRSRFPLSLKPWRTCVDDPSQECPGLSAPEDESYQLLIDRYGVRYWASDADIVRKELLDIGHYSRPLIAGIKAGDSHDTVEKKLHSLGGAFPDFDYLPIASDSSYGGDILTDICLRSSNDAVWRYEFDFDKNDRLVEIKQEGGPLPEQ